MVVILPIKRGSGVLTNVSVWEHRALNNYIFYVQISYSNTIIITILLLTLIPNCWVENIPSP